MRLIGLLEQLSCDFLLEEYDIPIYYLYILMKLFCIEEHVYLNTPNIVATIMGPNILFTYTFVNLESI